MPCPARRPSCLRRVLWLATAGAWVGDERVLHASGRGAAGWKSGHGAVIRGDWMTALPFMASPLRCVHMLVWSDAVLSEGQLHVYS